jgi:hypothetical protein
MAVRIKSMKVGDKNLFDANLVYSRVVGLQAFKDFLAHELALQIPTSMFTETGEMRCSKATSVLKNQLKVEFSSRNTPT